MIKFPPKKSKTNLKTFWASFLGFNNIWFRGSTFPSSKKLAWQPSNEVVSVLATLGKAINYLFIFCKTL